MRLRYSLVMSMALLMLASGASLVAACGKKGPLYHPAEAGQQADKEKTKKTSTKPAPQP